MKKQYNLKFSSSDHRDYLYERLMPEVSRLPSSVDLRSIVGNIPIWDQGELGSCSSHAWLRMRLALGLIEQSTSLPMLSRLYHYVRERMLEGTVTEDSGAMLRDGGKVLTVQGACEETLYPYDISKFTTLPTTQEDTNATKYKASSYYSINTLTGIKQCLATGYPVVFGTTVYEEIEQIGPDGFLKLPTASSQVLGGHAICIVGYKNASAVSKLVGVVRRKPTSKGYFIVANSWGTSWGDKGYFYVPYEYLTKAQWEAWSAR